MVRQPCGNRRPSNRRSSNRRPGNLHPSNCRPSNRRTANTATCKVPHVPPVSGRRPSAGSEPEAVAAAARTAPEAPDGASRATVRSAAVLGARRTAVVRTRIPARLWVCAGQNTFPTGLWPRRSSTVAADDRPRRRPAWAVPDRRRRSSSCPSSTRPRTRTVRCCSSTRRPS